jgi:large subunit ribosomal protein L10
MTKQEKNQAIEILKEKFSQYNNFYITNTESLTVAQIGKLRKVCFNKNVEMKVAKNTLIRKALEQLDETKYQGAFEALNGVTALMFSDNAKEPALILTGFRKDINAPKPVLKAAFINGDVFLGDDKLVVLKDLKSKNDLIGEVIGLLQSPAKRVIAGLLYHHEKKAEGTVEATSEAVAEGVVADAAE